MRRSRVRLPKAVQFVSQVIHSALHTFACGSSELRPPLTNMSNIDAVSEGPTVIEAPHGNTTGVLGGFIQDLATNVISDPI